MAVPTLDGLERATVTFDGVNVTVLFRDRDRNTTQFKQMVSFQMKRPIQFIFQTREGTQIEWWFDGQNYNPYGGPSVEEHSTTQIKRQYNKPDGSLGRAGGPAFTCHAFGVSYIERWTEGDSVLHRAGGPALIEVEYGEPHTSTWGEFSKNLDFDVRLDENTTGTIIKRREQTWSRHGKCTRQDSWAKQMDFSVFEHHQPAHPMSVLRTAYITQREIRWYDENEQLHRVDGPAVIKMVNVKEIEKDNKMARWQCRNWSDSWHIRGTEIPKGELVRWAKHNHIQMLSEPCYDRSAFATPDGELCFITDFAKEYLT